jgi:hypothetical protein
VTITHNTMRDAGTAASPSPAKLAGQPRFLIPASASPPIRRVRQEEGRSTRITNCYTLQRPKAVSKCLAFSAWVNPCLILPDGEFFVTRMRGKSSVFCNEFCKLGVNAAGMVSSQAIASALVSVFGEHDLDGATKSGI